MHDNYFYGVFRDNRDHQLFRGGVNHSLVIVGPTEQKMFPVKLLKGCLPPQPLHKNLDYPLRQAYVRSIDDFHVLAFWDWEITRTSPVHQIFMAQLNPKIPETRRFRTLLSLLLDYLPRFKSPEVTPFTGLPPERKPDIVRRKKSDDSA